MKHITAWICSFVILLGCAVLPVSAAECDQLGEQQLINESVEYLEDGSMIITSVYEELVYTRSNLYNKSGSKVRTFVDNGGNVAWTITVYGEFRILEGASVTCISATCSTEIFNSDWSCTKKSAAPSGSWAVANGEFAKSLLGIVVSSESVEVSLTSDVYGNLS